MQCRPGVPCRAVDISRQTAYNWREADAQEREHIATNSAVNDVREQAARIEPGAPGECELCGEWTGRLIRGACAPCRDRYKLP